MSETLLDEYTQVIENVPYGVSINDLDGRYVRVNQAFCNICGYQQFDLLSMGYRDVTHPDDIAGHFELDTRLRAGNIPYFQLKKRYLSKDGMQKHCLLQVSLIHDAQSQPAYYYAQVLDVTDLNYFLNDPGYLAEYLQMAESLPEQQRYSSVLYEVLGLYRKLNQSKSSHLGFIAHELRNPLHAIKGLMPLLRKSVASGDVTDTDRLTAMVDQSCERMRSMVDGLLDLTCIETGNLVAKKARFDVFELILQVIQTLEGMSIEHNIELCLFCEEAGPVMIESDEERMWEILANLISNGIKYKEEGRVEVYLFTHKEQGFSIEVKDSGIGIAPQNLSLIFDEFRKVPVSMNKQVSRSGLGLPITRRLVSMLGGEIQVTSELGMGSVFSVRFPRGRVST